MGRPSGEGWDDIKAEAWGAVSTFIPRSALFIVPGPANQKATEVGSGTLFATPRGRLIALTAAHVVEDFPRVRYSVGFSGHMPAINDAVTAVIPFPEKDIDVAVVRLREGLDHMSESAIPLTAVAREDDASVDAKSWCVICGYPARLVLDRQGQIVRNGKKFNLQLFGAMVFGCIVVGTDDNGRWCVEWEDATADDSAANYEHLGVLEGVPQELPPPNGISGGALWRFRPMPANAVWTPESAGRIVGVPVAWNRVNTQYAAPASRWSAWFCDVAAMVDST